MKHRLGAPTEPTEQFPSGQQDKAQGTGPRLLPQHLVNPYVGQPVTYMLAQSDAGWINRRRLDTRAFLASLREKRLEAGDTGRDGHFLHVGSPVSEGDRLPAVVSAVYDGGVVNLRVHLDGQDTYWATNRPVGEGPGTWWPAGRPMAVQMPGPVQVPAVGKSVHYVAYGSRGGEYPQACRAAVITEVGEPGLVSLCVMTPQGQFFNQGVPEDAGEEVRSGFTRLCHGRDYAGGSWHWPAAA